MKKSIDLIRRSLALLIAVSFIVLPAAPALAEQTPKQRDNRTAFQTALNDVDTFGGREAFVLASNQNGNSQSSVKPTSERSSSGNGADVLEKGRRGYIHPFLTVSEYYTDNVFFTRDDKKTDFITVISPGIWIAIPRMSDKAPAMATSNLTAGGSASTRFLTRYPGHYQTFLLYRADIERYSKNHSENTTSHNLEGGFQYNFRGGLSVDVADQYSQTHNPRGTGQFFELDKFRANFFGTSLSYEAGDRMLLRLDYSNYRIHYTEVRNDFRDRTDNAMSAFVFYKIRPRLALFGQYEYVNVDYDETFLPDSREHHIFGGLRWDITEKTKGSVKAGYAIKEPKGSKKTSDLTYEAILEHRLTSRTSLRVNASRKYGESDVVSAGNFTVSDSFGAGISQRFTPKLTARADLSYARDKYQNDLILGSQTGRLRDQYYKGGLGLEYAFREWLSFDLGYTYSKRDSNFTLFDYVNNTVFFRVSGSL
ncbi:MAG: porin [Nitrospirae bacterium]|nr:MAG: porin [Nitrospirota bacterium]